MFTFRRRKSDVLCMSRRRPRGRQSATKRSETRGSGANQRRWMVANELEAHRPPGDPFDDLLGEVAGGRFQSQFNVRVAVVAHPVVEASDLFFARGCGVREPVERGHRASRLWKPAAARRAEGNRKQTTA